MHLFYSIKLDTTLSPGPRMCRNKCIKETFIDTGTLEDAKRSKLTCCVHNISPGDIDIVVKETLGTALGTQTHDLLGSNSLQRDEL